MKKIELKNLSVLEQSGELAYGFVCGGGCSGFICLKDDGTFHWIL